MKSNLEILKDTIQGQIRNVFPEAHFKWSNCILDRVSVGVDTPAGTKEILVVREEKILPTKNGGNSRGVSPGYEKNATWYLRARGGKAVSNPLRIINQYDGVIVNYGPSWDGGEIWEESSGNDRKGSYRRLAYSKDVIKIPPSKDLKPYALSLLLEIGTTLTEKNIERFFSGKPLEDVCDYSSPGN